MTKVHPIVGAWRYVGTWLDGKPKDRGGNPQGMLVYTSGGHINVQIAPDRERTKAGEDFTPEEAKYALDGYVAYFGTYTIDETTKVVTHHRWASVRPGDAKTALRGYAVEGNRLFLRPPGTTQETVWERID